MTELLISPGPGSLDHLYLILVFLVPGLVVLFVRSQFVTGHRPSPSAAALSYLTISLIYYAVALPFVELVLSLQEPGFRSVLSWFTLFIIGPAGLGLLLGVNLQKGWFRRFLQWCGLNPVHAIPTAWDWKFGGMTSEWVLVTLKDGSTVAGLCGPKSFMSSTPTERDIYIEQMYVVDEQDKWTPRENGVFIAADEVLTIEFWPYATQEDSDDQD